MDDPQRQWRVFDHGPIEKLTDNLWRVEGSVPKMPLRRVMTVARLESGDLAIHSAVAMGEKEMAELEAWGRPAFLLVPNGWHRLDAPRYLARYPQLQVLCPGGARKNVSEKVEVHGSYNELPQDPQVQLRHLDGLKEREGIMTVRDDQGVSLVFNDLIMNNRRGRGLFWLIYALVGSTGGPKITPMARLALVADRKALKADLLRLADTLHLQRLIPGHGAPVVDRPAEVLRDIASAL